MLFFYAFFNQRCKTKKIKNTLNLHPAAGKYLKIMLVKSFWIFFTYEISCFLVGIQPWEESYTEMAKAMGIDPSVSN